MVEGSSHGDVGVARVCPSMWQEIPPTSHRSSHYYNSSLCKAAPSNRATHTQMRASSCHFPPTLLPLPMTEHTYRTAQRETRVANMNPPHTQRRPPGRLRESQSTLFWPQHASNRWLKHTQDIEMVFVCTPGLSQWSCHANVPTHTCPADASTVPQFLC